MKIKEGIKMIAGIAYYEKLNPKRNEKYISVREYKKRFGYNKPRNAMKKVEIFDELKRELLRFESVKEARAYTELCGQTVANALNEPFGRLVKNRYRFRGTENKIITPKIKAEYSNKQFV